MPSCIGESGRVVAGCWLARSLVGCSVGSVGHRWLLVVIIYGTYYCFRASVCVCVCLYRVGNDGENSSLVSRVSRVD